MEKKTKRHNNVTVSIFAGVAKGEYSEIHGDAIGTFIVDREMHGLLHVQERSEALIKSTIQLIPCKTG